MTVFDKKSVCKVATVSLFSRMHPLTLKTKGVSCILYPMSCLLYSGLRDLSGAEFPFPREKKKEKHRADRQSFRSLFWRPGGRRSEVGGQRSEVGGQRSEVGGQRSKVGGQRSKVGGQRSKVRGRRSEIVEPRIGLLVQERSPVEDYELAMCAVKCEIRGFPS